MNVTTFFDHWSIMENPFRAEEARNDPVFARIEAGPTAHPDFDKILGDLSRPSSAIVFGEKGSGKTAIRMQIASRVEKHNASNPRQRLLLVLYDDLNPLLDRFCGAAASSSKGGKSTAAASGGDILKSLRKLHLVDHIDGLLCAAVPAIVDQITADAAASREMRRAPTGVRRDLQLLAALYDRPEEAERRAAALRRAAGIPWNRHRLLWRGLALSGWLLPALAAAGAWYIPSETVSPTIKLYTFYGALAVWVLLLLKWYLLDRWFILSTSRRLARRMKGVGRGAETLAAALERLPPEDRRPGSLPVDASDDKRYAMLDRLRRVAAALGYAGMLVVMDRIDEPTLISGDPDRMRAVVWPLLNNKFLQQEGIGIKLLLPIELRHELFRESSAFFQEARLDKQNLIERLVWTGPTLYDLCNARLAACRSAGAPPITLTDLFAEEVTRQDVVDALDQMRQPRDAFKMLYQCVQEHCSTVTDGQNAWRIPRLILETVRKQQADRVQMLYRGVRPA